MELFEVDDTVSEEPFNVVMVAFEWFGRFPMRFETEVGGIIGGFPNWVWVWCSRVREVRGSRNQVSVVTIIESSHVVRGKGSSSFGLFSLFKAVVLGEPRTGGFSLSELLG